MQVVPPACEDMPCIVKSLPERRDLSFGLDLISTESPAHNVTLRVTGWVFRRHASGSMTVRLGSPAHTLAGPEDGRWAHITAHTVGSAPLFYKTLGVVIPADIYLKASLCLGGQQQLDSTQK